ncbi:MAG: hypothetical protein R2851_09225 [Caldilineaceae bacterium]
MLSDGRYVNLSDFTGPPGHHQLLGHVVSALPGRNAGPGARTGAYDDLVVLAANVEEPIGTVSPSPTNSA